MPLFNYTAKDREGKEKNGSIEAPTRKAALNALNKQDITVTSLSEEGTGFSLNNILSKFSRVSLQVKVEFTRQLATMINAGLPLAQSLEILEDQTKNEQMKKAIGDIIGEVRGGSSLSNAFGNHPKIFSKVFISLIKAGEASGSLDKTLLRLADTLEKQRDFRAKTKGALIYPVIIVLAMVGVFAAMMVLVIPKLSVMYENLGVELPVITQTLINISDFFVNQWYVVIGLTVGGIFAFKKYRDTKKGRYTLARILFKLPIVGVISKQTQLTEFTRTLSLLVSSGVPILEALEISAKAMTNVLYKDGVEVAAERVKKGEPLSKPLKENEYFPPLVSQMVSVGEQTGKIDEVLMKLSAFYETESERSIENLSTALEPIIMIALGGMVALLMLSVITPIYNLTSQF